MRPVKYVIINCLKKLLFTACVFIGFASSAHSMQICQMVDTLVWELESGLDISPAKKENHLEGYDVLVVDGVLYYWERLEDGTEALTPVIFDEQGKAQRSSFINMERLDAVWFKVSETEFRILDITYSYVWHSKLTCPDAG